MERRTFITGIAASGLVVPVLAACGVRTSIAPGTVPPMSTSPTTVPPTTVPPIDHPTGADEFVVRVKYAGGLVANNYDLMRSPSVLVTGDGFAVTPGAVPAVYPGPLLPALRARTIAEIGVQSVLRAADSAQLLGPAPDYSIDPFVMDAADTVLEIHARGEVYTHQAYALDMEVPSSIVESEARKRLRTFVQGLTDLVTLAGAENLGPDGPLHPDAYRVQANPVDPSQYGDPAPTVVPWPAGTGVELAKASQCVVGSADKVGALFEAANQLTFFEEGTTTYSLVVAPALPGDPVCPAPGSTASVPTSLGG